MVSYNNIMAISSALVGCYSYLAVKCRIYGIGSLNLNVKAVVYTLATGTLAEFVGYLCVCGRHDETAQVYAERVG